MLPDYGLFIYEKNYDKNVEIYFADFHFFNISIMGYGAYTTMVELTAYNQEFAASFDFDEKILEHILAQTNKKNAAYMRKILQNANAGYTLELEDSISVMITAKLGEQVKNKNETYVPFSIVAVNPCK